MKNTRRLRPTFAQGILYFQVGLVRFRCRVSIQVSRPAEMYTKGGTTHSAGIFNEDTWKCTRVSRSNSSSPLGSRPNPTCRIRDRRISQKKNTKMVLTALPEEVSSFAGTDENRSGKIPLATLAALFRSRHRASIHVRRQAKTRVNAAPASAGTKSPPMRRIAENNRAQTKNTKRVRAISPERGAGFTWCWYDAPA